MCAPARRADNNPAWAYTSRRTKEGTVMVSRISVYLVFLCAPLLFAARVDQPGDALVAHEWGTFTSVASENGDPVSWLPLSGSSDLPCFVYRLGGGNVKSSF